MVLMEEVDLKGQEAELVDQKHGAENEAEEDESGVDFADLAAE